MTTHPPFTTKGLRLCFRCAITTIVLCMWWVIAPVEGNAQNSRIKCYFNHPVNNQVATGANALYLNAGFDDTVAAYIDRAKYSIDIALYNYTSTAGGTLAKVATAANNAFARGVEVRWIYDGSSTNSGLSLLNPAIPRLGSPTTAAYGIMHNKFMVIDANSALATDASVLTGSYNWSATQTTVDFNNIVVIQDQPLARAYVAQFNQMWGGSGSAPNAATAVFGLFKSPAAQQIFNVNGTVVELYFSPKDASGTALKNVVNSASKDLFFGIYTFTDTSIANRIAARFNNGVLVRGIMDQFSKNYTTSTNTPYYILSAIMGNKLQLFTSSALYHNKVMVADASDPNSDPQVATGSFNWSGAAQNSNDENLLIIHNSGIANQFYQSLCEDFTSIGGINCTAAPCLGDTTLFTATRSGSTYQWQVDAGSGFVSIADNAIYTGSSTRDLTIAQAPASWYGYQFRCVVNGVADVVYWLKFTSYWNGSVSTAWEDPLNWNCGRVPGAFTDVVIANGVPNFPAVNASTQCRSIRMQNGAAAQVKTGVQLQLTGQ